MTLQELLKPRLLSLYVFLFCATVLGIALYMEHGMLLEPCPLCIMQRVFFLLVGITGLIAFIHNPAGKMLKIYGWTGAALALVGGGFAIRQIWLQHLPADQIPACGPSLGYMLEVFPLAEVLKVMFTGDGNCAEVLWVDPVIGLGIPEWSLVGFLMLAAAQAWQAVRK